MHCQHSLSKWVNVSSVKRSTGASILQNSHIHSSTDISSVRRDINIEKASYDFNTITSSVIHTICYIKMVWKNYNIGYLCQLVHLIQKNQIVEPSSMISMEIINRNIQGVLYWTQNRIQSIYIVSIIVLLMMQIAVGYSIISEQLPPKEFTEEMSDKTK